MLLFERGERALNIEKLYKASIVLGVHADYLIKDHFPNYPREESLNLLLGDLSDKEFTSMYDIIKTVK